jgi:hypothetical protein
MFIKLSEHFEFRHFRPHYLDVDTTFGDLGVNVNNRNYSAILATLQITG